MADSIMTFFVALVAYLAGIATETARSYFSDMLTDRRRNLEAKSKEKEQFRDVVGQMPDLINEIKKDLNNPEQRLIREFFISKKSYSLNVGDSPSFVYYVDDHIGLQSKVHILENHGYVKDITPGNAPMYRMTEDFVRLLKEA
jgi:hypothetical protein